MAKILLVEDDKSLREIYGVRLMAEGYEIVSAGDGEEALAMAIKERPNLIVSDVMMPKISGFDMLDILRSTTETKDVKVIMMTALSSDDQRARGEALGADRYLVKSQVGIEDVVRTVHDVLGDGLPGLGQASAAPSAPAPAFDSALTAPAPEPLGNPLTLNPAALTPSAPAPVTPPQADVTAPVVPTTPQSIDGVFMPAPAPLASAAATTNSPAVAAPTAAPIPAPTAAPAPNYAPPAAAAPQFTAAPPVAAPTVAPVATPAVAPVAPPQSTPPQQVDQPASALAPLPVAPEAPTPVQAAQPVVTPVAEPVIAPVAAPVEAPLVAAPQSAVNPVAGPSPVATPEFVASTPSSLPQPTAPFSSPAPASLGERVIEPLQAIEGLQPLDISAQIEQALNTPVAQPVTAPNGTQQPLPPAQ